MPSRSLRATGAALRARAWLRSAGRAWRSGSTWRAAAHLGSTALLGPLWGVVLAVGLAAIVLGPFGVPVVIGTLGLARQGARVERDRARALLGVPIAERYRSLGDASDVRRLWAFLTDPGTWRDLLSLLLLLPAAALAAGGLAVAPLAVLALALPFAGDLGANAVVPLALRWAAAPAGLLVLAVAPLLWRALAVAHAALLHALLGPTGSALSARLAELTDSRGRAVEAGTAERRRIERDLHDGAQQRLVALALDLGMAREKLDSDPDAARSLLEQAHGEAKRALAELRDLARGIYPAVLTDRGLDAALSSLAARSPVPVTIQADLPRRLPPSVEVVAYFVVAEALTNVARHAAASRAEVRVTREGGDAVVVVADDGMGGARPGAGSGLRGLRDRVVAVDGRLDLRSPPGGPTELRAVLPCGS